MAKKNGVELAKAYVQIIPSMEGMQENIETALNGGGGVGGIGSKAGEMLGKGLTSAFTKAVGFLKDSLETGMGFDSAMSQVAATMGTTVDEITELRDKAKEMGAATNYSATQAAEGLNILAMSGYDAEHSMEMLEDVLHLAAAGGMEMSEAAGDISGAMKGFGDASKDSAYYADLMAKGATLANTSVSQLGQALSDGSAMGKAYSQSAEGMTVSLLRLAEQGEVGSGAATALAAAYANLYTPMDQAKEVMNKLGVEAYDPVTGKAREFNTVVNELNEAIQRESQGNEAIANQYKDLIFGKQGLNAYNKLVVTSTETQEQWAQALRESTGSAAQQYDTMTDNLAGDMDKMKSAFEGLQIEISEELSDDIRSLVQIATDGLTWATEHANTLIGIIEGIGVAWAAMKLPAMIGAVTTAMRTLNAVCAANPILAAFTIATSAGLILKGVIDDMTEKINEIPDAFEGLDAGEVDVAKRIAEGTNDLAEAEHNLGEAEVRLKNAQTERDSALKNLTNAERELSELRENDKGTYEEWVKMNELEGEVIPELREQYRLASNAVGEMAAAKMDAKAQVDALTEAQEQLAAETEDVTSAEEIQGEVDENLAEKKELLAEKLKTAMKNALEVNIELNDKTIELSRTTAQEVGQIIDSYDEMYAKQEEVVRSSFNLFEGFTADTSVSFDDLLKNINDTNKGMQDWGADIQKLEDAGLDKGLIEQLRLMGEGGYKYVHALASGTKTQLEQYNKAWLNSQDTIESVTQRVMQTEREYAESELSKLLGVPNAKLEEIKAAFNEAGLAGIGGYEAAINSYIEQKDKAIDKLVDKQVEQLGSNENFKKFKNVGTMLPLGLAQGMNDPDVMIKLDQATSTLVGTIVDEVEKKFEVSSPSKVFAEIGAYLPAGLAVGMEKNTKSAEKAVEYMADSVISAAKSGLDGFDLDLGANVNVLDSVVSQGNYSSSDYTAPENSPAAKSPVVIRIVTPDRREVAEWVFPDLNELLGKTTTLQARGIAR